MPKLLFSLFLSMFTLFLTVNARHYSTPLATIATMSDDLVPVFSLTNSFVKSKEARIYINSSTSAGKIYWVVYPSTSAAPNAATIKAKRGTLSGQIDFKTPGTMDFFTVKGLNPQTSYKVYATLQGSNEPSDVISTGFTTTAVPVAPDLSAHIVALKGVLGRLMPNNADDFALGSIPPADDIKDVYEISTSAGKVIVKGSSASAITSGIRHYLGEYCNVSFSWSGDQTKFPPILPSINGVLRKETPYQYRYSLNYCTYNYTMSFWNWDRWEREIDLMAMQGVNLVLAPLGSHAVWQKTLEHFGYTFAEIQDFLTGPAFDAWFLMGNLEGEGGKVSQEYINASVNLQNKILARMRSLGISPILQGYAGMAPTNFKAKFPTAEVVLQGKWNGGFQRPAVVIGQYCDQFAKYWYEESVKLFGPADFYGGDFFHESGGVIPEDLDLTAYAKKLQSAMLVANPTATWVLQAWGKNPRKDVLKGIKKDQALIIDYSNDIYGFWKDREGFDGYPWIYGVINNFGGRMGIYGRLQKIANDVHNMQNSSHKLNNVGIGIAPEAIIYNPVSYDLMWDLAWEKNLVNTADWIKKFADRRYGLSLDNAEKAWGVLNATALNCTENQEGATESVFNLRPRFTVNPRVSCCATTKNYYESKDLIPAWIHMMNAIDVLKSETTFRHDLVDITRQIITNYGKEVYDILNTAIKNKDKPLFVEKSALFLEMMLDQDSLLRTNEEYLLGKWINDARLLGTTNEEADLFEQNARALVTTWGLTSGVLKDYAHQEWAGLTKDFYRERWKIYIDKLIANDLDVKHSAIDFYNTFERPWTNKKGNGYDIVPNGEEIAMSEYIYKKYAGKMGYASTNASPVVPYQTFIIKTKSKLGQNVGKILATDTDANQTLTYSIYSQPFADGFVIDESTGKIFLNSNVPISMLTNKIYKMIVRVQDNGTPSYVVYREIAITYQ